MKKRLIGGVLRLSLCLAALGSGNAHALPAFALREKVSCVLCHSNGSAPHLTKTGYLYRRAGFRFPSEIGDKERDKRAMELTQHMAVGGNFDYQLTVAKASPGAGTVANNNTLLNNNFNVRELELWPLVGGFLGNFGAWTEFDETPSVTAGRGAAATGGVTFNQADLRYVVGNKDLFFGLRGGALTSEGYGASDQWIDDGNFALFDSLAAQFNQNTLATPIGPNNFPHLGMEFGASYHDSFLTFGIYNGVDGSTGAQTVGLTNPDSKSRRDYKLQLDQFYGENFEVTGVYYNGRISLLDSAAAPAAGVTWVNNYSMWRLYPTVRAIPGTLDVLGGGAFGTYNYIQPGNLPSVGSGAWNPDGTFHSRGAYFGVNVYPASFLTLSARAEFFQFCYGQAAAFNSKANGLNFMASFPYENSLFVFHFNNTWSDRAVTNSTLGMNSSVEAHDFRGEWRFLF